MVTPIITKNLFGKQKKNSPPALDTSRLTPFTIFTISVNNGAPDKSVAYGPGSIIHGQITLQLPQRTSAYCVRVVFKCNETRKKLGYNPRMSVDMTHRNSNPDPPLFQVESVIWGKMKEAQDTQELTAGRHMFLFAVKLPMTNYPPSLNDPSLNHSILYTLQGFLDLPSNTQDPSSPTFHTECTAPSPVCFLPLIPCSITPKSAGREVWYSSSGEPLVEVVGELGRPACCPGDVCTAKLSLTNKSDHKITALHVSLVANMDLYAYVPPTSPLLDTPDGANIVTIPTSNSTSAVPVKRRTSTLHSEIFHVSIPRSTQTTHGITLRFNIPTSITPTVTTDICRSVDIRYNVIVAVPLSASPSAFWSFNSAPSSPASSSNLPAMPLSSPSKPHAISLTLPLVIATVPSNHPTSFESIPSFLDNPQLPTFIKIDSDSAPPSPTSPISPWDETPPEKSSTVDADTVELNPFDAHMVPMDATADTEHDPDLRNPLLHREDAAGYLLPPAKSRHPQHHHKKVAGDATSGATMEVPALIV